MENKLPAREQAGMTQCCICHTWTGTIHWHHTIPRSLGGTDSLQIPIDADCHNNLHAKADAIVAMIRSGGKRTVKSRFWAKQEAENRAEQWLQILIHSMLYPPVSAGEKMILLPSIKVDMSTRQQIQLLQKDLPGVTNLEQLLQFCINYTLHNKGYKNYGDKEKHSDSNPGRITQENNRRKTNLW